MADGIIHNHHFFKGIHEGFAVVAPPVHLSHLSAEVYEGMTTVRPAAAGYGGSVNIN